MSKVRDIIITTCKCYQRYNVDEKVKTKSTCKSLLSSLVVFNSNIITAKVNHIYSMEAQENSPANSHLPFLWATSGPPESP